MQRDVRLSKELVGDINTLGIFCNDDECLLNTSCMDISDTNHLMSVDSCKPPSIASRWVLEFSLI